MGPMYTETPYIYIYIYIYLISCVHTHTHTHSNPDIRGGCPSSVMVKAMDCGIVVREFVFQSRYYIHFQANTLGKGMNPLTLPAMG